MAAMCAAGRESVLKVSKPGLSSSPPLTACCTHTRVHTYAHIHTSTHTHAHTELYLHSHQTPSKCCLPKLCTAAAQCAFFGGIDGDDDQDGSEGVGDDGDDEEADGRPWIRLRNVEGQGKVQIGVLEKKILL